MRRVTLLLLAFTGLATSCEPRSGTIPASAPGAPSSAHARPTLPRNTASSPIAHVVIIFQENRTPDNLFQALASEGADIQSWAIDSHGDRINLRRRSMATHFDLGHGHPSFVYDYDCGKMDGFDSQLPEIYHWRPFTYVPLRQVQPYVDMAQQYVFADRMFETQQAGSFPAHQEIISGTASALPTTTDNVAGDPYNSKGRFRAEAGCDAPPFSVVDTISPIDGSPGPRSRPCFDRPVLTDLLDVRGVTWRYYENGLGPGLWHAFDAIAHVRYGRDYVNVVTPPETVLSDVATGNLPAVAWVMPADKLHSDHPAIRARPAPRGWRRWSTRSAKASTGTAPRSF